MSVDQIISDAKQKMQNTVESFRAEIARLRTGRASLNVLDNVRVDYYGQKVPLNQVATLGVPEPRLITISPWDAKQIPEIERAIVGANLGLSPVTDGRVVRLPIPPLTEERRKELIKSLKKHAEDARISARHTRRELIDSLKALEKSGKITEDELEKQEATAQKLTDSCIETIESGLAKKEAEMLQV